MLNLLIWKLIDFKIISNTVLFSSFEQYFCLAFNSLSEYISENIFN